MTKEQLWAWWLKREPLAVFTYDRKTLRVVDDAVVQALRAEWARESGEES